MVVGLISDKLLLDELRAHGVVLGGKIECGCGRDHPIPVSAVVCGRGEAMRLAHLLDEVGANSVCVVDDEITRRIAALRVIDSLRSSGFEVAEETVARPNISEVERLEEKLRSSDIAVAVGGGSVIDVCKLASYRAGRGFISVPTALSNDGIASSTASIIDRDGIKRSFEAKPPFAVAFDLEVLESEPRRLLASGCGDLLSRATSLKDWELGRDEIGEYFCERIASLALASFEGVLRFIDGGDLSTLARAMFKSSLAMVMIGSSRPCSGSEHLFSHYLDKSWARALHGEQVGFGTILMSLYHEQHNERWWRDERFQPSSIKRALARAGAPTTLRELGIGAELATEALINAAKLRPDRYTILHKRPINKYEAKTILRRAEEI